jgi:hypothetical protein
MEAYVRPWRIGVPCLAALLCAGTGMAQDDPAAAGGQQDHSHHVGAVAFTTREASGTAWQPDLTPMYGVHIGAGNWEWMLHGNAFGQYLYESGNRGADQAGSINWFMAMARRNVGSGRVGVRTMFSAEPGTIGGCGYPDLLATGELCGGETIHDRQHQHDVFMELAVEYDRPLAGSWRWQAYAGAAGEPALGPVAFPHRASALSNPLAPISHHWLDASHITFGVITGGLFSARWKLEGSVFNGREPDEDRIDLDFAALDSYSARVEFNPSPSVSLQISGGRLTDAEAGHAGDARASVTRATASVAYHHRIREGDLWATTAAWGRNLDAGEGSNAFLLETSLIGGERHVWFGRFEVVGKPAHDLDVHDSQATFNVSKLQAGYTRYLSTWNGLRAGLGGGVSAGILPAALGTTYGRRVNAGFSLFVTLRPVAHQM